MIPVKIDESEYDYSNFQPDQILTADNLNHIFDFLYLQERLTRTNLIGIGIVCGLAVSRSADGKSVTITKGTAVTSHGYLMAHGIENSNDPVVYKKYRNFDAKKEEFYYDVFINKSDNSQKYALWELVAKEDEINTDSELSAGFLDSKVCLLFYEVLDEKAKNCDPTSCDDKGVKVYVNVRKLLVSILDADKIIAECNAKANASGSGELFPDLFTLPEIKLPKFDVPATTLETANDVYEAYQQVFTKKFVESTGETLKLAYTAFKPMLQTSTSVFDTFNTKFAFLHNGSISGNSLLHFQYYYELFADLALAYKEWRDAAYSLAGMCTPPEALFPRHVFLGTFTGMSDIVKSKYRNYFIPSPILQSCRSSYQEFQSLFQRIVRIIVNVDIPTPVVSGGKPVDNNIRITPSVLGKYTLGDRAIPYYYKVDGSQSLLSTWNYLLTARGKEKQNLHYNPSYSSDDFVKNPLEYDIEPYNFFRIEGHIGKKFDSALASIQTLRNNFRLPFDIVALTVDTLVGKINPADFPCHFVELEAQYDILRTELMCTLCKSVTCLYLQPLKYVAGNPPIDKLLPSKLDLIPGCKSKLQYGELTVGVVYEEIYPELKKGTQDITGLVKKAIGTSKPSDDVSIIVIIIRLIHANVLLADVVPANLSSYTSGKVLKALDDQKNILKQISDVKDGILYERFKNKECIRDLYDLCDLGAFTTLYKEYQTRIEKLKQLQSLKEFSKLHPGIQHKGGVPSGGTFILVYRDLETDTTPDPGIPLPSLLADQPVLSLATTTTTVAAVSAAEKKVTAGKKLTVKEKAVAQQRINLMTAKGMKKDEIESILGLGVFELAKVKGIFEDALENVAQGVVIADFYLPYLCCSDCPPVQFVVNIP
ncbi:MAG TPA: hypothetical protein VIN08_12720, partial [Ohtaekwangia sp.]|uniref:hypothetical protein n=1 Tax=Ohtaekwangia sp. TaxID=2066019 RepID=UPI002F93ED7A